MEGLVEGIIVHFVLTETDCRPAIIVNAWGGRLEDGMINLQIFLDGTNDLEAVEKFIGRPVQVDNFNLNFGQMWMTSVKYSEAKETGTWHWPERS